MDLLKKFDKNRGVKGLELLVQEDKNKHRKIYVGSYPSHIIYLKSFCGMFDFQKFMVEAVILRMIADKSSVKKALDVYNKIYDSVEQIKKERSLS